MKERKFYQEKFRMLKENEMFTDKDKVFMETSTNVEIESPNFDILIKRNEKEPFIAKDEHSYKTHEKLVQKFSMHHYDPVISGNINGNDYESIHDKGVVRAINANYDPYKDRNTYNGYANNTIFVSKLPENVKNNELQEYFSKYGELEKITIPKNIGTGVQKGYAFIEYKYLDDAINAYENSHKTIFMGREILVDFVRGKNQEGWVPRRYGGGLGGDIKSGQQRFGGRDAPHKTEKRDRYHRDYSEEYDDYDDHRHKRYRDYDQHKLKRSDSRKYYDRYDSYHDYEKKYYSDPYINGRYEEYERYPERYRSSGYYDGFDERSYHERDERRYIDKRHYDRRYEDHVRYDERGVVGERYVEHKYDDYPPPKYDDHPRYEDERRYEEYANNNNNNMISMHHDHHHHRYDDRKVFVDKRSDYLPKTHYSHSDGDYPPKISSSSVDHPPSWSDYPNHPPLDHNGGTNGSTNPSLENGHSYYQENK